ncbi:hypothetical protein NX722_25315 [Endozoicomonas gorgoniicola]|uniref:Mor transcription activator domain-containing protein n=1 Tax=Endozoicomonas gorgoniicola TaxID=1234144 RepID=A0ABT3N2N0_9GAMM|nr:Mor transcription activator family protein [Endozoicomonas gorgoniicola]MCW7555887.1 hypothetical protein [Endozoicomonas gorgoniicola]
MKLTDDYRPNLFKALNLIDDELQELGYESRAIANTQKAILYALWSQSNRGHLYLPMCLILTKRIRNDFIYSLYNGRNKRQLCRCFDLHEVTLTGLLKSEKRKRLRYWHVNKNEEPQHDPMSTS